MTFLKDLFGPKWEHSDPNLRRAAIGKIVDQNILAQIAKGDIDRNVRKAAIEKIADKNQLAEIIKQEKDVEVIDYANERLSKTGKVSIVAYEINAGRNQYDDETAAKICASFLKRHYPYAELNYHVIISWPGWSISKEEATITYISLVRSYRLNNCGEPFKRENIDWNNKKFYVMFFNAN